MGRGGARLGPRVKREQNKEALKRSRARRQLSAAHPGGNSGWVVVVEVWNVDVGSVEDEENLVVDEDLEEVILANGEDVVEEAGYAQEQTEET